MKNDKQSNFNISKFSIILSAIAIIICIVCAVYNKIMNNDGIMIWVILGLANLSVLFANLSNYKNKNNQ